MFPTDIEVEYRRQELERTAENFRFVRDARTVPTLWERLRARLSARPNDRPINFASHSEQPVTRPNLIATSR
ncbi:MAG: hypothetical protein IT319_09015 [Anaerolineae bacterium]|nr:hypothetical protein [Anaerolineae bacterium]